MSLSERLGRRAIAEVVEIVRFLGGVIAVWLVLVTFGFAAFHIPSESMQPTLEVGDRVLVSKWAYGYSRHSLPLGAGYLLPEDMNGRIAWGDPQRGDVVVFRDEVQEKNLIKRVIGLPGDTIEVREGRLYINGELAERDLQDVRRYRPYDRPNSTIQAAVYVETLPNGVEHLIYEEADDRDLDDYGPLTVRPGHVFVMGDNRDRSSDSRASLGEIPVEAVVGRAETVLFTFARCRREEGVYCPTGRVWRGL